MDFGLILPAMGAESSRDGIAAAAELAERHGFSDVWGIDHLLVDRATEADYGRIFEILTTMAWVAARVDRVRIGTSVVIVPMRSAIVVAKQLATIDALSNGRLIAGLGVGWNAPEFANVGMASRFRVRGAYLEEAILLFRHLWSGSTEPFHGMFSTFDDAVFGPLPPQGPSLPIWLGGRSPRALERTGRMADGYHASSTSPEQMAERIPLIRAAAEAAGRPMPVLSGRVRVELDSTHGEGFALRGTREQVAAGIRAFGDVGVSHLALAFPERDPEGLRRSVERFVAEVRPLL